MVEYRGRGTSVAQEHSTRSIYETSLDRHRRELDRLRGQLTAQQTQTNSVMSNFETLEGRASSKESDLRRSAGAMRSGLAGTRTLTTTQGRLEATLAEREADMKNIKAAVALAKRTSPTLPSKSMPTK